MIRRSTAHAALAFVCLALLAGAQAQVPQVLTLHPVPKVDAPPTLDGKIDDPAWKAATPYSTFYYFWKYTPPRPAAVDTTFWLTYTDEGLYLAIANYRDDMSTVKANIKTRDAGDLWLDSSNEIYIDSAGTAVSYRKFTINSIGTRADQFQLDAANRFNSWTKDSWKVVTSRDEEGWYAELFFPFEILGAIADRGDMWRFAVLRFAQIPGGHAASAPGSMYSKPQNFGWLYFLGTDPVGPRKLAEEVAQRTSDDWFLPVGQKLLVRRGDKIAVTTMTKQLRHLKGELDAQLRSTAEAVRGASEKRREAFETLRAAAGEMSFEVDNAAEFSRTIGQMQTLQQKLENVEYEVKLQKLLEATVAADGGQG